MMMTEKTLSQLLDEYNALGNDHLAKTAGFTFRERKSFKDKADAISSMNRLQSSIKANEEGIAKMAQQEEASTTEKEDMTTTTPKKKAAPAKKTTNGAARGRRSTYSPDQKIVVIVKDNPRREGTSVYKQYELAKKHNTVGAYLKAGGSLGSLRKAVKKNWMRVTG